MSVNSWVLGSNKRNEKQAHYMVDVRIRIRSQSLTNRVPLFNGSMQLMNGVDDKNAIICREKGQKTQLECSRP